MMEEILEDENPDSSCDAETDASTDKDSECPFRKTSQTLLDKKVDPFLLQAILLKAEYKGIKSQYQHRRRCETSFQSLSARYTDLLGEAVERKPSEPIQLVEECTETNSSDVNTELIEQLAKRISHLKSSIALEKRKNKDVTEDVLAKKKPVRLSKTQTKSSGQKDIAMMAKMARHRWQVAIGMVMGMAKMATRIIQEEKEPFTVGDLIFDPAIFKANKSDIVLTADSKFVLSQLPERRTKEQVEEVAKNLHDLEIKSFNDYPTSVQLKLVQVARYEVVTPQRVIIRQGRPAENFFFLIDGTVVVIERVRSSEKVEESEDLIILRKGAMFGETEMANRLNRRATVISKGNVELLTIERNDFLRMFIHRRRPNEFPDHIKFLRQCEFIDLWPIDELVNDLDRCTPYFFKQNALIVEDSVKTGFLVVIRSGQCRVIRKLYKKMILSEPKPELCSKSEKAKMIEYNDELLRKNFRSFSRHGSKFDSLFRVDPFEHNLRVHANMDNMVDQNRLPPNQNEKTNLQLQSRDSQRFGEKSKSQILSRASQRSAHYGSPRKKKSFFPENNLKDFDTVDELEEQENKLIQMEIYSPKTKLEKALLLPTTQEYSLTVNEDKEDTKVPVYIQIDTLKQNEVFGLDTLVFDKYYDKPGSTGLCLVSGDDEKGVDVVLLSKSLFIEHASEQVAWRVRRMMKSYPESDTLLDEIERQELWGNYKQGVIAEVFTGKPLLLKRIPWK